MKFSELIAALEEFQTKLTEHEGLLGKRAGQRAEFSALEKRAALEEQSRWLSRRLGALRPYIERFDDEWMMQHPASGVTWDALDVATSLTGHPGKNHSLGHVLPKLHQILGRLENFDPNEEIPADPMARRQIADQKSQIKSEAITPSGTAISGGEDWITAASALSLLGMKYWLGTGSICKRAHAGLIQARAGRFIQDGRVFDNADIPAKCWWAEGGAALNQNWTTGDFDTWIDHEIHLQAFDVTFRRSDIERLRPAPTTASTPANALNEGQKMATAGQKIFIGHGHSPVWRELKDFLQDRLHLTIDEFNSVSTAGVAISNRLEEMLGNAAFAFLILTAEDEQVDGKLRARENVVHEAGLFQGRLGFKKAILLLEETCDKFSNAHGLGHIPFPPGNIKAAFEQVREVLEREKVIDPPPKPAGAPPPGGEPPERRSQLLYTHPRSRKE